MRAEFSALRDALGAGERAAIDARVTRAVLASEAFAAARSVFTYLSVGAEVDTRALVERAWEAGKVVAAPRCVPGTRELAWHRIDDFTTLVTGAFGIEEPLNDPATLVVPDESSVALVPAFSFDADGFRLGYGGGFYDAFLASFPGTSIGLCRACQLSTEPLPREPHDVAVNFVVTDAEAVAGTPVASAGGQ